MSIAENLQQIQERIADAANRSGRSPDEVALVAVSKTWPVGPIREAYDAGQRIFGENKVQEIEEKVGPLPADIEWHLIGHLQKNKVRKVLPHCASIHSIDSFALAERVGRIGGEEGLVPKVLLQVNVANDDAKFGFPAKVLKETFAEILQIENLEVSGLMTVPSYEADPEKVRPYFAKLCELRDDMIAEHDCSLPELSMGMSHDFEVAIEEGSTMVRVGSAIFGQRDYRTP